MMRQSDSSRYLGASTSPCKSQCRGRERPLPRQSEDERVWVFWCSSLWELGVWVCALIAGGVDPTKNRTRKNLCGSPMMMSLMSHHTAILPPSLSSLVPPADGGPQPPLKLANPFPRRRRFARLARDVVMSLNRDEDAETYDESDEATKG